MYHGRFNGTHYEIGLKWGGLLLKNGKKLLDGVPFPITEERIKFSRRCIPSYEQYFPEVLEEIEGIAAGQKIASEKLMAVLLSMYCIMPEQKCSCVAFKNENHIILARNSDFLRAFEAEDKRDPEFAKKILSGRFGFMCRYERATGKDTVWSVIYDLKELEIYRCEGNPSRRKFIRDKRFALLP